MIFTGLLKFMSKEEAFWLVDQKSSSYLIGDDTEPAYTVLTRKNFKNLSLIFRPSLRMPEAYMNGTLTIQDGKFYDFLNIASKKFRRFENSNNKING